MEKHINKKVESHQLAFKNDIKQWFVQCNASIVTNSSHEDVTSDFLKFVYDYGAVSFTPQDFEKRKRIKNTVPHCELCTAKRSNGEQCTRRKKDDAGDFCGTHLKGQPHGVMAPTTNSAGKSATKVEVWVQEIRGINYYVDCFNNVYRPEDILANKQNPAIIAKWALNANGNYTIPAFNI